MIQLNLQERTCFSHPQNNIILACFNKYCNQNKLICCSCLGNHAGHINNLIHKQAIMEKIAITHEYSDNLVKKLFSQFDELNLLFNSVIEEIKEKYYLPIQKLNSLNNEQFSEYITHVDQFQEFQETILKNIKEGCENFANKLQLCLSIIGLSQLSYIQKASNEEIKQANDIFEKANNIMIRMFMKRLLNSSKKLYHQISNALRFQGQFQESIEYYEKAILIDSQRFESAYGKGVSLYNLEQYRGAINCFDKAIQIDPKRKLVYYEKGHFSNTAKQQSASIRHYKLILQYLLNYYYKGNCLKIMGQFIMAIQEQEKVLEINQNFELSLVGKCQCLIALQKFDEAQECVDKILKFNPNSATDNYYISIINSSKKIYEIELKKKLIM